jgi:arginine decarboxylase
VTTTAVNTGDRPCPYGTGHHPYLSPGDGLVDDCDVQVTATTRVDTDDERQLPTGVVAVEGTPYDFRSPRRLGGLAVDYDGSNTNFVNSRNYTVEEYCSDIVESVMSILDPSDVPHPTIITESGRTTVAYYSVLLANVLDVEKVQEHELPEALDESYSEQIRNLFDVYKSISLKNLQECYNDALYYRDEVRQQFLTGRITLRERTLGERYFWAIMKRIAQEKQKLKHVPKDLAGLEEGLADIYYGNFSVFQSLPDIWAIDQVFPVMPIHRLDEIPSRQAILADITCDCDGKIDRFAWDGALHEGSALRCGQADEEYYLGAFVVGA